jgi:hypothetical protein
MEMTYDGGISFAPDKEEESFTWGDAFRMTNSAGMFLQNPELYGGGVQEGYHFMQEDGWDKLSASQLDWVRDATSPEDFQNRLGREKLWTEAAQRFQADESNFNKYGKSFIAGAADPVGFVPYAGWAGKAMQVGKTANTLARMGKTFAVMGTFGAATNVASDYILEQQGAPVDYASSALWGFALAGTLGSTIEGISRTRYKAQVSNALLRDDMARAQEIDATTAPKVDPENPDAPPRLDVEVDPATGQPTKLERGSWLWQSSDVHKLHSSDVEAIRKFGWASDSSALMSDGVTGVTARAHAKALDGKAHEFQMNMAMQYRDAVKDGVFKGSIDDYFKEIGAEYQKLAADQEFRVETDPEAVVINDRAKAELKAAREEKKQIIQDYEEGYAILRSTKEQKEVEVDAPKDSPEYQDAWYDYLTQPNAEKIPVTGEGLAEVKYPKGFGGPAPKYRANGQVDDIKFPDNIVRSIYIAGSKSKSKTKQAHLDWLEAEFGFKAEDIQRIRDELLADVKAGKNADGVRSTRGIQEFTQMFGINYLERTKDAFVPPKIKRTIEVGRDTEEVAAARAALDEIKKQTELELEQIKGQIEEVRAKDLGQLWTKHKVDLPPHLQATNKYFREMLDEGKGAGVKELDNINPDRLYYPRQIDFHAARNMDGAILRQKIFNGLRAHPANAKKSDESLLEAATTLANDWRTKGIDMNYNDPLFSARSQIENKRTYGERRLKIDNREIADLLQSHAADVVGGYHYFTKGQIALRKAHPELKGTYSTKKKGKESEFIGEVFNEKIVKPVYDEINAKGLEPTAYAEDIQAMKNVFNDLMGNLRIFQGNEMQNKIYAGTRIAAQANSAMLAGWFGLIQALEIPSALWATGFNRLFHRQYGAIMKDVLKALGTDSAPNSEFLRELTRIGYLSSLFEQSGINRMADTNSVFNMGKVENFLHKLNSKLYKYNGMRAMTSFMEAMVASNAVTLIRSAGSGKIKPKQAKLLRKWGLTEDDIKAINGELDRIGDIAPNGTINKLGLDEMEISAKEKLMQAMGNAIEEGVIQGDSMKLPNWMIVPGPFKQLVMQFMRFPIAANEILLRKGVRDDVAGMAASVVGAYMIGMGIRYLEEQARIKAGFTPEYEAQYDIFTEEGLLNNVMKTSNYIAAFGGLSLPYQYMTSFLQTGLFGEYKSANAISGMSGVTISRIQQASDALKAVIDGKADSTKVGKFVQTLQPLHNFPIYKGAVDMLIEEHTINY